MFTLLASNNAPVDDVLIVSNFLLTPHGEVPAPELIEQMNELIKKQRANSLSPELITIDAAHSVYEMMREQNSDGIAITEKAYKSLCTALFDGVEDFDYNALRYSAPMLFGLKHYYADFNNDAAVALANDLPNKLGKHPLLLCAVARAALLHIINRSGLMPNREAIHKLRELILGIPEEIREKAELLI